MSVIGICAQVTSCRSFLRAQDPQRPFTPGATARSRSPAWHRNLRKRRSLGRKAISKGSRPTRLQLARYLVHHSSMPAKGSRARSQSRNPPKSKPSVDWESSGWAPKPKDPPQGTVGPGEFVWDWDAWAYKWSSKLSKPGDTDSVVGLRTQSWSLRKQLEDIKGVDSYATATKKELTERIQKVENGLCSRKPLQEQLEVHQRRLKAKEELVEKQTEVIEVARAKIEDAEEKIADIMDVIKEIKARMVQEQEKVAEEICFNDSISQVQEVRQRVKIEIPPGMEASRSTPASHSSSSSLEQVSAELQKKNQAALLDMQAAMQRQMHTALTAQQNAMAESFQNLFGQFTAQFQAPQQAQQSQQSQQSVPPSAFRQHFLEVPNMPEFQQPVPTASQDVNMMTPQRNGPPATIPDSPATQPGQPAAVQTPLPQHQEPGSVPPGSQHSSPGCSQLSAKPPIAIESDGEEAENPSDEVGFQKVRPTKGVKKKSSPAPAILTADLK